MISDQQSHSSNEQSPIMLWRAAADGSGEYFDQRWLEFTGRTLAEERGEGWTQAIHCKLPGKMRQFAKRNATGSGAPRGLVDLVSRASYS